MTAYLSNLMNNQETIKEFTAKGSIPSAGLVVSLNDDNTVSVSEMLSGNTVFTSSSVGWYNYDGISTCFDSVNNKICIAYRNNTNGYGYAVVGTINGDSISFGTPVVFSSTSTKNICCCFNVLHGKVVITYKNDATTNYPYVISGIISGTTISFSSAVAIASAPHSNITCGYEPRFGTVIVLLTLDSNSTPYVYAVNCASANPSIANSYNIVASSCSHISLCASDWQGASAAICLVSYFNNTDGKTYIHRVDSSSLGNITNAGIQIPIGLAIHYGKLVWDSENNNPVLFGYKYSNTPPEPYYEFICVSISGSNNWNYLSFNTSKPKIKTNSAGDVIRVIFDKNVNKIALIIRSVNFNAKWVVIYGTMKNGVFVDEYSKVLSNYLGVIDSYMVIDTFNKKTIFAFADPNNSNYGTVKLIDVKKVLNSIGISQNSATDTQPVKVVLQGGVAEGLSGLTPLVDYYDTGEAGGLSKYLTAGKKIGKAITDTQLLVTG